MKARYDARIRIRDVPNSDFAGYPAILKTGFRISGSHQIPDIRPDILPDTGYFVKVFYYRKDLKEIQSVCLSLCLSFASNTMNMIEYNPIQTTHIKLL